MLVCPSLALGCNDAVRTMGMMDGRYFVWEPRAWGSPSNETIANAQYELGGSVDYVPCEGAIPLSDDLPFDKVMEVLPITFDGADHYNVSISWRAVTQDEVVISHKFENGPNSDYNENQLYISRTKGFLGYTFISVCEGVVTVEHHKGSLAKYITDHLMNSDCMLDKEIKSSTIAWVRPTLAFPNSLSLYFADWQKFPGVEDHYLAWIGILENGKNYVGLQSVSEDRKSGVTHYGNTVQLLTAFRGKSDALEKDQWFEYSWSDLRKEIK